MTGGHPIAACRAPADIFPFMILNRQRGVRVSIRALNDFLTHAQQAVHLSPQALTICLVTNAQIARWNRAYRGKNGATDVLSFPAHTPVKGQVGKSSRASKRKPAKDGFSSASYLSGKRKSGAKRKSTENGLSSTSFASSASSASYLGVGKSRRASGRKPAKNGFSSASYLGGKRKRGPKRKSTQNGFSSTSFASSASSASYLGDIAIAPAVARQNARRFGRTFGDELRILILHGILHLMGYDHETDTGQMERRERRLRRRLGIA